MATTNVRKTLTDAGYIAVGLGVMGIQQAQARTREAGKYLQKTGECVSAKGRDAQAKVQERSRAARDQASTQVHNTVNKAQELRGDVAKRVEPAVEKVQAQIGDLPERVVQAMEPVAARVREIAGSAA